MVDQSHLEGENIIIFSSDDWWSGLKTSKYHVARQLARRNNVLFVNSVGIRAPRAAGRDVKRMIGKVCSFVRGAVKVAEGPRVFTPVIVPFARSRRTVGTVNRVLLCSEILWLQRRLEMRRPIVITFLPVYNHVIGRLGEKAVVYYCIDDMRGYEGLDIAWFDREEDWLLSHADCVVACSRRLCDAFQGRGYDAQYIPHGVDWRLFRKAVDCDLPLPRDMRQIREPRLGFYGFLSDEVVDYPLLVRIATAHPEWQVVLIGRPGAQTDMRQVENLPNVHYLGLKPFEELPAYTRHFAIGLMPFRLMGVTINSNPLKMLEYLAGGLPVVSTDIPEVRKYEDAVHIARNHEEFVAACDAALKEGGAQERNRRSLAVKHESWERRVEVLGRLVRDAIERRAVESPASAGYTNA